jgi:CBS domain-containing membrane protein
VAEEQAGAVNRLDRLFTPLLAGAHWRDRMVAALGALIGIGLTGWISTLLVPEPGVALLLAAPIGASAVLLFAVPSSPLAQPFPIIGGSIVSTASGMFAAQMLGHGALAAGFAVALAILLMSVTRCLHAPGGGCALVPVVGGPAILAKGYAFALVPFGLNAVLLVAVGLIFHRFSGHSYPHRAAKMAAGVSMADIDAALEEAGEAFDVSRKDLQALLAAAERHARGRSAR